jgi:hypothetical protein
MDQKKMKPENSIKYFKMNRLLPKKNAGSLWLSYMEMLPYLSKYFYIHSLHFYYKKFI